MSLSINLIENNNQISQKINSAIATEFNDFIHKRTQRLQDNIKLVASQALVNCPEIKELQNGILTVDFGLTTNPVVAIIESIIQTLQITIKKSIASANKIVGGLTITMQPTSYSNLYSLGVAYQPINGGSLPWLKWLLEAGDSVLIVDFGVEYGPYGRTGGGHMTNKSRPFKVNSSYSGVVDDNFITRAFQSYEKEFVDSIIRAIN